MSNNHENGGKARVRRKSPWRWARRIAAVLILCAAVYAYLHRGPKVVQSGTTFAVQRGPLVVNVIEGGNVDALESQEIRSQVLGQTKILSIVEEGYTVTQEDVDNKKILVELDSKDLADKKLAKELDYQNAYAAFTQSKEEYGIQINQNDSDLMAAQIVAKFARMDFQRYMGAAAAHEILKQVGIPDNPDVLNEPVRLPEDTGEVVNEETLIADIKEKADDNDDTVSMSGLDLSKYLDPSVLGDGEAGQRLRTLQSAEIIAQNNLTVSDTRYQGTKRLAEKNFVTKNDLEVDRLTFEQNKITLETAQTSKNLFITYEFPKMAEKYLSDYYESLRKFERARKLALSKLAQALAKLKSSAASYALQTKNLKEVTDQIAKCKIVAERPGLVVYENSESWHGDDRIQEGALVRERQKIITIPDMTQMAVKVKVHESSVKSVEKGQKAKIVVDAYPDEPLTGEVVKVSILPDSANRWMNPDVKVYETSISIEGIHEWLKPGMSAQVEILVKEIPDVLFVPIQAIVPSENERVCFVSHLRGPERRMVETGEFNNQFIEIKSGLKEGEKVLLRAPVVPEDAEKKGKEQKKGEKKAEKKGEEERPKPPPPQEGNGAAPAAGNSA